MDNKISGVPMGPNRGMVVAMPKARCEIGASRVFTQAGGHSDGPK